MCRKHRADDHRRAASRTVPRGRGHGSLHMHRGPSEQAPSEREARGATSVGQEAKLPNADKAPRQDVLDEAPKKLHRGECHRPPVMAVRAILTSKGLMLIADR